jgi:hypothetical protein
MTTPAMLMVKSGANLVPKIMPRGVSDMKSMSLLACFSFEIYMNRGVNTVPRVVLHTAMIVMNTMLTDARSV